MVVTFITTYERERERKKEKKKERKKKERNRKEQNNPSKLQNKNAFGFNTKNLMK